MVINNQNRKIRQFQIKKDLTQQKRVTSLSSFSNEEIKILNKIYLELKFEVLIYYVNIEIYNQRFTEKQIDTKNSK